MARKNYKKILTELFRRYNPAKVAEVDTLLKQFAGREEELIHKIRLKYAPKPRGNKRRKPLVLLLVFLVLGGLGLGGWYAANQGWIPFPGLAEDQEEVITGLDSIPDSYSQEDVDLDSEAMQNPYSAPPMEYGVQVGLFSDPDNAKVKRQLGDRQLELNVLPADNGLYMYVVGNDLELEDARHRRDELRENGFPDAFVVGLRKGKRVEVKPGE
jgi:hypothetical protein